MKKFSLIAAAALVASSSALAADLTDSYNVTVNFSATCVVSQAAADVTFDYTAFDAGQTKNTSAAFRCSRGLTPTFSFDNPGGAQTGATAVALGTAVTGEGVISGVRYTLSGATSRSTTGTAASAGANGTGGSDGTADVYTVAITAAIASQAGTGSTPVGGAPVPGMHTRVLTISY